MYKFLFFIVSAPWKSLFQFNTLWLLLLPIPFQSVCSWLKRRKGKGQRSDKGETRLKIFVVPIRSYQTIWCGHIIRWKFKKLVPLLHKICWSFFLTLVVENFQNIFCKSQMFWKIKKQCLLAFLGLTFNIPEWRSLFAGGCDFDCMRAWDKIPFRQM